ALRHRALNVRDVRKSVDFYCSVRGMHVEWEPDADNIYLSSGSDNLALHRAPAGSSTDGTAQALDHLGLIVRAGDDVDRWAAFLESRGVTLDAKPKTHRDGARSCYFSDPDGNSIQIINHPRIRGKMWG